MHNDFRSVAVRIRYDMLREELSPGTRLPSIGDYAVTYGCSRPTAIRAMRLLADEGLVAVVPGQGIYSIGLNGDPGLRADRPRDKVEQHIRSVVRDVAPGAAIPASTSQMMRLFGVSYTTVRRVEMRLEVLGVIRRATEGHYVRP